MQLGSHVESKKCTRTRQTEEITMLNDKTLFGRVQVKFSAHASLAFQRGFLVQLDDQPYEANFLCFILCT